MSQILSITAPIFILIGLGYLCVMVGLVSKETTRGMGGFVITIALPALILSGLVNKPLAATLDMTFLGNYALASLSMFSMGLLVYRLLRKASLASSSIAGLGMACANSSFIGVSICAMVLGTELAARTLPMVIMAEVALIIPIAMAIADADSGGRHAHETLYVRLLHVVKQLSRNPLLISIAAGLLLAGFRVPVPGVAMRVIEMLAPTAAPVALFAIGGALYGLRPGGMILDAGAITFGKLVVHPLVITGTFFLFDDIEPALRQAALLYASIPMLSIYPILGMRYGVEDRSSAALLLCTVLSFFTISTLIALIT